MRAPAFVNLALAALFWTCLFGELWFEWSVSEQYAYGLFIPFLGAYLLWLRVEDRPPPRPALSAGPVLLALALIALAHYPIAVLFAANADWRLLAWTEALLALATSLLLLARWGGLPWLRHFLPALLLFLFAVPWPNTIEIPLVDGLMSFVAIVTTNALHLLGFAAVCQGHTIQLPSGFVEVEEACSGVRSIQSTIMAGWLVGELWRFRPAGRLGLLVWACVVAVVFNLLRTFILAWISAVQTPAAMVPWHDLAGYVVFALSFATVLGGAWLARPRAASTAPAVETASSVALAKEDSLETQNSKPETSSPSLSQLETRNPQLVTNSPAWLPVRGATVVLVLLFGALPAATAWYAFRSPAHLQPAWHLDLAAAVPAAHPTAPDRDLAESLFTTDGLQADWTDSDGRRWLLYYFVWNHARAAQLGGVHVPERCLPAVGWVLDHQGPNLTWTRDGVTLVFNTFVFLHGATRIFVFYGQWDPAGYNYYDKTGRIPADRLFDAWSGDRMKGKHLLEIGLLNTDSLANASAAVQKFLNHAIAVAPPAN